MIAARLLDELPDGASALVLAIEHLWAVPLRDAVRDAGGVVIGHRSLSAEDLIALGMVLRAEAELETQLEADTADADYEAVKDLYVQNDLIDTYDAAVISRHADGKVKIVKKHEQPTRQGAWGGLGIGLVGGHSSAISASRKCTHR